MRSTSLQFRRPVSRRWNADRRSRSTNRSSCRGRAWTRRRPPASSGRPPPAPRTPAPAGAAVAQSFVQPGRGTWRARLRPARPPLASRPGFRGRSLLGLGRRWRPTPALAAPPAAQPCCAEWALGPVTARRRRDPGIGTRPCVPSRRCRRNASVCRSDRLSSTHSACPAQRKDSRSPALHPFGARRSGCAPRAALRGSLHCGGRRAPLRRGGSEWQFLPPPTAQEAL